MATPVGQMGTSGTRTYRGGWPLARAMAMIGGILGLIVAMMLIAGSALGDNFALPGYNAEVAGTMQAIVGSLGVWHVIHSVLVLVSAYLLLGNPRLHGALLTLYGILGIFVGFGLFLGAVLVLVAGIMAWMGRGLEQRGRTGGVTGRRPAY